MVAERRRALLRRSLAIGLVATAALSCDSSDGKGNGPGAESPEGAPSTGAESSGSAGGGGAAKAEPSTPVRVRYDLAAHVARAEMRHGDALVVDMGVPGGAKHTLGGWQTGVGGDHTIGDATATVLPDVIGRMWVPAPSDAAAKLTMRLRVPRDGRLTVYVGDDAVAHPEVSTDAFETIEVDIPEGKLRPGENLIQLRVPRRGVLDGIGRVGVAIDWWRLRPATGEGSAEPPPGPNALAKTDGGVPALEVPGGWTLGWALDVMKNARLRGLVKGEGALRVVAHRDGAAPRELGRVEASAKGAPLDLSLGALEGRIARIDLTAEDGDVRLLRPAVVTPEPARAGSEERAPRVENVLVYLVDTLRADKLQAYDPKSPVETPGFSRYVKKAALFERAHSQENWTKPSCATLLSSVYPWNHHATRGESVVPRTVKLLPEMLGERGFFTGAFIANGYVSGKFGFERGWDTWRNYIREGRRTPAEFVAADVLEWLDQRPGDKPFFLYVHTIDPHVPYIPPDEVLKKYDPDPYRGRVSFVRDRLLLGKVKSGRMKLRDRDKHRLEALHDGEITYHDTHFTAIMDALERRELDENTIVVITSDHGEEFFDHGSVGHGHSVYEELLHVPFVIRVPGLTDGPVRIDEPVGLVDVLPTIFDALGRDPPEQLEGRSLLPLLRGKRSDAPRIVTSGFHDGWRTALVDRLKVVQRTWEHVSLYDLDADPGETEDLSEDHPLALRYARGMLGLALHGQRDGAAQARARRGKRRRRHQAETTNIDPETEEQLRALGYVH